MQKYELLYILPASLTSEEIVKNFTEIQQKLEKLHAKPLETLLEHPFLAKTNTAKEEEPLELHNLPVVKKRLAYPIKHEKVGFYCLVNFEVKPKYILEIDKYLRHNNNVLRHMITVADPMTQEELVALQELFARKKAEQDREEMEKDGKNKDGLKKNKRVEKVEQQILEENNADQQEEIQPTEESLEDVTVTTTEDKKTNKDNKKTSSTSKKSKIKLEELENKLDEILENAIVK